MKKEDIENLIGESMEDMGLEERCDEQECECCGHLIEDDNENGSSLCLRCRVDFPYCHHK